MNEKMIKNYSEFLTKWFAFNVHWCKQQIGQTYNENNVIMNQTKHAHSMTKKLEGSGDTKIQILLVSPSESTLSAEDGFWK